MNDLQQTAHKAWASLLTALAGMLSMPDQSGTSPFGLLVRSGIYALYKVPTPPTIDLANATYAVIWAFLAAAANGAITYLVPNQTKLTPLQRAELAADPAPRAPASSVQPDPSPLPTPTV